MSWYQIKAAAEAESNTDVYIFGVIGWEVMAAQFVKDLKAVTTDTITIHINSEGGGVFDGIAIYNAIRNHKAKIITRVEGIAASMASVIALAGEERLIADAGFLMIHNPWTFADGESDDLRKAADVLDKVKEQLVAIYCDRLGKSADEVKVIMDAETWWNADEAISNGAATGKFELLKAAARLNLSCFAKAPKSALEKFSTSAKQPEETHNQPKGKTMNEEMQKKLVALGFKAELNEETLTALLAKLGEITAELQKAKDDLANAKTESANEQARIDSVLALGVKHNLNSEAVAAVKAKTSIADFTNQALDAVAKRVSDAPAAATLGKPSGAVTDGTEKTFEQQLAATTDGKEKIRLMREHNKKKGA